LPNCLSKKKGCKREGGLQRRTYRNIKERIGGGKGEISSSNWAEGGGGFVGGFSSKLYRVRSGGLKLNGKDILPRGPYGAKSQDDEMI